MNMTGMTKLTKEQPSMRQLNIDTDRLKLRRYHSSDADQLQQIINHADIAEMTLNIPHPYDLSMAHNWLSQLDTAWTNQQRYVYAITLKDNNTLIGTVSLSQITRDHANLGYWIGVDYWHQGYCSEAIAAFIQYIFENHLQNFWDFIYFVENILKPYVEKKIDRAR